MAKKKKQEEELLVDVEQKLSNVERFFEENQNLLISIVGGILVIVGGYFAFTRLYIEPREKDAQFELYKAQEYLEDENFDLAINGDGESIGLIAISEDFKMTKAANLAQYYLGVAYLNQGEYDKAIRHLDKFSTSDDILSVLATGAIGDAFMELNQPKEALQYYQKATKKSKNELAVPPFLQKAAYTAEILDDKKKALSFFKRIVEEFPESQEASNAKKSIRYLETAIANQ